MLKRSAYAVALIILTGTAAATEKRPNIVFAFADDLGRYASAYSDPKNPSPNDLIRTPHFDRVAGQGTLFDNALVSSPSCTPSRAAIISGRHFFRNGSHSQLHSPWVKGHPDPWDSVKGFALMLQDHGYHIGWSYKMHISEDRMGGKERNYRRAGGRFNTFSQNASKAADPEKAKGELLDEVRQNFRDFLGDRKDDQPFYYWFNPTNTHRTWVQGSGQRLWGLNPDDLKGKLPPFLPDNELIREDFADYLGEGIAFDASVGVLLEELERLGELDDTIVVVSGDHGAPGFPRGKCNLYDFGTQVLLAVRWPGRVAQGRRIESPVSLIDLTPTFLKAAGLEPTPDMNGQSLLPALDPATSDPESKLRGYAIVGRETHVDQAREGRLPYPMRAIRTADHLYIRNFAPDRWPVGTPPLAAKPGERRRLDIDFGPTRDFFTRGENDPSIAEEWNLGFGKRPAEELYDVRKDPHQMQNLAEDSNAAAIKQRLSDQLMAILKENDDPRLRDDFDRPPYVKPD